MRESVCYRVVLGLRSVLSIGAADSVQTDHDVVLDSRGKPLLPATSLAGLYRSRFDELRAMEIFGEVMEDESLRLTNSLTEDERSRILGRDGRRCAESAVRVYDGEWDGGNETVSTRDSVALKDKVAVDKLKFDRQAVQVGARFVTRIEIIDTGRCSQDDVEGVISAIHSGELRLGSKSTRGFGRMEVLSCKRRRFGTDDVDGWLGFDLFANEESPSWTTADDITKEVHEGGTCLGIKLRLELELRGGISIREYTTEPSDGGDPKPDYGQMIVHGTQARDEHGFDVPVVPGTSWAGAFRERYESIAGAGRTRDLFGYVDPGGGDGSSRKSRISFDESTIREGEWKTLTRNAIDRFTGGTMDGALYTERSYFGGTTELFICVSPADGLGWEHFAPLVVALADLNNGFLAVGGLTSVGRGLFRIRSAELMVDGVARDGFTDALLAPAGGSHAEGLVAPDVKAVARLFCREGADVDA